MKGLIKHEEGSSLVEFVLVLPVMLIMLGLICDMGRAVHTKINLQQLTGEIQRLVVLYEEAGVTDGIRKYSSQKKVDEAVEKVIKNNASLDKSKLKCSVKKSEPERRTYIGHHYNPRTRVFERVTNWNDSSYVSVYLEYEMPYITVISKNILGEDSITLFEEYTGVMYLGGDN